MEEVIFRNPYTPFRSNAPQKLRTLFIAGTASSPIVLFDTSKRYLMFKGISCPENAPAFYSVVLEYLRRYQLSGEHDLKVYFNYDYVNTSSSKCLFELNKLFDQMRVDGMRIDINWCYEQEDEDMLESGEDISFLSPVKFNFICL